MPRHRRVLLVAAVTWVLIFGYYVLIGPVMANHRSFLVEIPHYRAAWHAIFPALALALLGVLSWERFRSPYRMMHFTIGRVIAACILFGVLSLPLSYLPFANVVPLALNLKNGASATFWVIEAMLFALCLFVAATLTTGIKSKRARFGAYVLVWNGVFFAVPLFHGLWILGI